MPFNGDSTNDFEASAGEPQHVTRDGHPSYAARDELGVRLSVVADMNIPGEPALIISAFDTTADMERCPPPEFYLDRRRAEQLANLLFHFVHTGELPWGQYYSKDARID